MSKIVTGKADVIHLAYAPAGTQATVQEALVVCPVAEGALARFLVRQGEAAAMAVEVLRALHRDDGVSFVPAELSYGEVDLAAVRGHREVTDGYLVALAAARDDTRLATLDRGPVATWPALTHLVAPSA